VKGYHGVTVASASLTGLPNNHRDFDLPIANITHTACPHFYRFGEAGETEEAFATRMAETLEAKILEEGPDTVAAFIAEPIMGAGGVLLPPATYFEKVQAVLKKYDVLFIDDEVICGFARTGNMFGAETFDMQPNTMSVAKALSSAYLPIAACVFDEGIYQALEDQSRKIGTFAHGYTYSGHPACAAVALKTLELMEKRNVLSHVRDVTPTFQRRLKAFADHPLVGEARGIGLIGAVELVADKKTKRSFDVSKAVGPTLVAKAQEHGVILRAIGDGVAFCPPLIITEAQIDELFDRFAKALDETEAWVHRENLRAA
jgi:4-aminobutyrate--pyruvate transaminase